MGVHAVPHRCRLAPPVSSLQAGDASWEDGVTTFVVLGVPATKGSTVSFMGPQGRIVTKTDSAGLVAWTKAVGWAARMSGIVMAERDTPVRLVAEFQFLKPPSAKGRAHHTVKPDIDKTTRALLDALIGIGYVDDSQVTKVELEKRYGPDARTVVTVEQGEGRSDAEKRGQREGKTPGNRRRP